jgi:sodium transport system ATP-binding protein
MNEFRDRRCDKLSTGMKQKTSIARTLVHDPPVMIFDEPTLGLDVLTARTVLGFIRECGQRGKTVIFSTHVMSEVGKAVRLHRDHSRRTHPGRRHAGATAARAGVERLEDIFIKVVEEHA